MPSIVGKLRLFDKTNKDHILVESHIYHLRIMTLGLKKRALIYPIFVPYASLLIV